MTAKEVTYVLPLEQNTDVGEVKDKLKSTMKQLGYETGFESKKHVSYLRLARFIADELTLRFTTRPPLSTKNQEYIKSKIPSVIDIFVEVEEK